ncbi:CHAT domain-containing tetratricopeptide repeat protein [Nocardioides sp. BP30]|uniref:CHAT domain-containing protein n=1 Tax=Nocardioides sp. BP30 TaxID=3036374 RepID=UPI0024699F64|nr:CHAT domain-containing tetratricopeptide repeat protein [Nocardioides sp. BP30]WGL51007.1 CHAT domain-containing tetratricopeptide repeat protein [Nocardioides sp. BP30]
MGGTERETARRAISDAEALVGSDPKQALRLLDRAVGAPVRRLDPTLSARASYLRAQLLCERGRFGAALDAVHAARRDWLSAGRRLDALSTDIGKATVLHELGDYRQAVNVSVGLLEQIASFNAEPGQMATIASMTARTHNNLGNSWSRMGDHDRALRHYDVAANLFQGLGEPVQQASADANRGLAYLRLGMGHRALDELTRAEQMLVAEGRRLAAAKCRIDIAETHLHLDQVEDAVAILIDLRDTLEALDAKPELGRLGLTLANAYLRGHLPHDARREAQAAADIFADLPATGEYGRATYVSALASMVLEEDDAADRDLTVAARLFADCGDTGFQARVDLARAQLAERRGDAEGARTLAASAVEQLEGGRDMVPATLARLLLAQACPVDEAEQHLNVAAEKIAMLGLLALVPSLELARARHERRTGESERAVERLRLALARTAEPAPVLGEVDLRMAVQGARTEIYDELVDLLLADGSPRRIAEAWQWSAVARARTLAQFIAQAVRAAGPGGDVALGAAAPDTTPAWTRDLPAGCGSLPAIPEGPVLHYHVLGTDVVAFVVREGEVHARRLPGARATSLSLVAEWQATCAEMSSAARDRVPSGSAAFDRARLVLADLHRLLVAPVDDLLDDLYGEPLLVVPHRHLSSVPFEALQDRGEPFSARHSLVFAPGLMPDLDEAVPDPVPGTTLVLAVPDAKAPQIEREAAVVGEHRPHADLYLGEKAVADVLLGRAPGNEIVHLACHGRYWCANPFYSALELADRSVTAAEIIPANLAGSLVVLSACAAGQSSDGAESTGLGWAFLAAGARGVVASSWAVEDDVAVDLMAAFYRHLATGATPRDALDAGRAEVRRTHPHPYYWGSFRITCSPATALSEGLS